MQVIVEELVSRIRAVDGESVLGPETLRQVVEAVCRAVREERDHEQRTHDERNVEGSLLDRERGR